MFGPKIWMCIIHGNTLYTAKYGNPGPGLLSIKIHFINIKWYKPQQLKTHYVGGTSTLKKIIKTICLGKNINKFMNSALVLKYLYLKILFVKSTFYCPY